MSSSVDLGSPLEKTQVSKLQKLWRPSRKNLNEMMHDCIRRLPSGLVLNKGPSKLCWNGVSASSSGLLGCLDQSY